MTKSHLWLLLVFTGFLSCKSKDHQTTSSMENEKLIRKYFDHFNQHKWDEMADMYTETADFKDPSLGPGVVRQTRAQVIKKYSELNHVFPNLKDKILAIYPSGENHMIVEFISSGTAADQSTFELPICTIFTIENGLITKDFSYFDNFEEGQ